MVRQKLDSSFSTIFPDDYVSKRYAAARVPNNCNALREAASENRTRSDIRPTVW